MGLPPPNPGCRRAADQGTFERRAAKVVEDETKLRASRTRTERFADYVPDTYYATPLMKLEYADPLAYALWGVALACIVAYIATK